MISPPDLFHFVHKILIYLYILSIHKSIMT